MNPGDDPTPLGRLARPRLAEGVRLQQDRRRGGVVLLYPEGVLRPNATGAAILDLCDGHRSIAEIAAVLAETCLAPAGDVCPDVIDFLNRLRLRQLVHFSAFGNS